MAGWPTLPVSPEVTDVADDLRRVFQDLERQGGRPVGAAAGQCSPALDVLETEETVEIIVDVPGVETSSVRVVLKGAIVLVAGEKLSVSPTGIGTGDYHLVERGFGRFARAVRVAEAFDGSRARASLVTGELRIVLPRIHDRRGQARTIAIDDPPASAQG